MFSVNVQGLSKRVQALGNKPTAKYTYLNCLPVLLTRLMIIIANIISCIILHIVTCILMMITILNNINKLSSINMCNTILVIMITP
jgi:hypothetical protein